MKNSNSLRQSHLYIGYIENPLDQMRALLDLLRGKLVAGQINGAFGLIGVGDIRGAFDEVSKVKGFDNSSKTRAALLSNEIVIKRGLIKKQHLHPELQHLLNQPRQVSKIVGCRAHLRYPIDDVQAASIPAQMKSLNSQTSLYELQVFDPTGHGSIMRLVSILTATGKKYPFVTSLNRSGEGNTKSEEEAIALLVETGVVTTFLREKYPASPDPYPIIHIGTGQIVRFVRNANEVLTSLKALSVV